MGRMSCLHLTSVFELALIAGFSRSSASSSLSFCRLILSNLSSFLLSSSAKRLIVAVITLLSVTPRADESVEMRLGDEEGLGGGWEARLITALKKAEAFIGSVGSKAGLREVGVELISSDILRGQLTYPSDKPI